MGLSYQSNVDGTNGYEIPVTPATPFPVTATGANGNPIQGTAVNGNFTAVAAAVSNTTLLANNGLRIGATVYNDSTAILYILLATNVNASTTQYTAQIAPGGYYELPFGYEGIVKGIWSAANGNARITEFT